jgi:hypothetical protein
MLLQHAYAGLWFCLSMDICFMSGLHVRVTEKTQMEVVAEAERWFRSRGRTGRNLEHRMKKFEKLAEEFHPYPPEEFYALTRALRIPQQNAIQTIVKIIFRRLDVNKLEDFASDVRITSATHILSMK